MDWITTTTLLERLRSFDDDSAWQRLHARFRAPVASFARSLGVAPDDAEDVAQETLLAFAQAYREGRYDPERGRLGRWLFGIAYRQACRQRRRDSRPDRPVAGGPDTAEAFWQDVPDEVAARDAWDEQWDRHVLAEVTRRARSETSAETFRAFELTVMEEKSAAEAAAEMGVPIKAVYNAKHRVLKRIRELRDEMETVAARA